MITVIKNYMGHLEIWNRTTRKLPAECDLYIQQDEEIQTALELMGLEDITEGFPENAKDPGYFN